MVLSPNVQATPIVATIADLTELRIARIFPRGKPGCPGLDACMANPGTQHGFEWPLSFGSGIYPGAEAGGKNLRQDVA